VLAFALTQRALALAPDDYGVRTSHAESLIAVDERTAAARLLDDTLQAHPRNAARARLLRAQLASEEGESAVVVKLVQPLVEDPEYGASARELLARHQTRLQDQALARESPTRAPSTRDTPPSGTEIWSTRSTLPSGGQRTFRTRNLQAGVSYIFHATGTCTAPSKPGRKSRLGTPVDLFGQDFRVRIGTLDPTPLKVGVEPAQNALTFRAPENNPQIFLEDRTTIRPDGPRCTISAVAVRVP
jgi:hypothetical protein